MPDLKHAIAIDAPAETVRTLCSDARGFQRWWAEDVEADGGATTLGFFNRATTYRLRLEATGPLEVRWRCESGNEWSGTELRFELREAANGCTLHFTHGGWRAETQYFVMCNTTWGELMFRIKAEAEGRGAGPLFLANAMAR